MKIMKREQGFTLIELIVVIAIIGILAAVAVPAFINVVDNAQQANVDAVEGTMRSAAVMYAANELIEGRGYTYPLTATFSILVFTEEGLINDWTDSGGVWTYTPTGHTLAYVSDGTSYVINVTIPS